MWDHCYVPLVVLLCLSTIIQLHLVHSITQLHLELVNLLLKKSDHRVALHYFSTMLQNLKLVLGNGVISPSNSLIKPLNLSVSQAKTSLKSLG